MIPHVWLLRETTEEYRAAKRARGLCSTYRCTRSVRHCCGKILLKCHTCTSRLHRIRNPEKYAYNNLRCSARKRDIDFDLTFEEFWGFVAGTDYIARRGKGDTDLSIDRIRTHEGYKPGNLRIMRYLDNISHRYEDGSAPADF